MLIKECLKYVPEKDQLKVVVFEGEKETFYGWFEYISNKGVTYLFKLELECDTVDKKVVVQLVLDGIKKEYSSIVKKVLNSIKVYYEKELGSQVDFTVEKTFRKKEVLFELLLLKK